MRRDGWSAARSAALAAFGMWIAGCGETPTGPVPAGKASAGSGGHPGSTIVMPDAVWSIVQSRCVWCHTAAHPTAGLDFTVRTQALADVRRVGEGVQLEMAPLVVRLSPVEKRQLLDWVTATAGPLPAVSIPATLHWELSPLLAGLADGAPAPGFGFVLEDGWIDGGPWKVATYRDRFGISYRSIALDQTHLVDRSIFPPSSNPSSYFVFQGIPWHGRLHDVRLEGDVRVDRWISVGLEAAELQPPGRDRRDYVRLQFDRDAVSLRSGPTTFETWPWGGSASSPGADARLTGTLDTRGLYQRNDEWLHFALTATRAAGGVRWTAEVTRRGTGATVASLTAFEPGATPRAGTFFLHAYAAGTKRNWANLVLDGQLDGGPVPESRPPAPIRDRQNESPGDLEPSGGGR